VVVVVEDVVDDVVELVVEDVVDDVLLEVVDELVLDVELVGGIVVALTWRPPNRSTALRQAPLTRTGLREPRTRSSPPFSKTPDAQNPDHRLGHQADHLRRDTHHPYVFPTFVDLEPRRKPSRQTARQYQPTTESVNTHSGTYWRLVLAVDPPTHSDIADPPSVPSATNGLCTTGKERSDRRAVATRSRPGSLRPG